MVLAFKEIFVKKILNGSKIHTIRKDENRRWMQGRKIHFATGVRTKKYNQFKEGVCSGIQSVSINPTTKEIRIGYCGEERLVAKGNNIWFAKNDGFETEEEFWKWFNEPFSGYIIHWTERRYS